MMYLDVRCEDTSTGSHPEPDLGLTDEITKIVKIDAASTDGAACMPRTDRSAQCSCGQRSRATVPRVAVVPTFGFGKLLTPYT
jgi:hypothetical protein